MELSVRELVTMKELTRAPIAQVKALSAQTQGNVSNFVFGLGGLVFRAPGPDPVAGQASADEGNRQIGRL